MRIEYFSEHHITILRVDDDDMEASIVIILVFLNLHLHIVHANLSKVSGFITRRHYFDYQQSTGILYFCVFDVLAGLVLREVGILELLQ